MGTPLKLGVETWLYCGYLQGARVSSGFQCLGQMLCPLLPIHSISMQGLPLTSRKLNWEMGIGGDFSYNITCWLYTVCWVFLFLKVKFLMKLCAT